MYEDDIGYREPMEFIQKCLCCEKPECINCLGGVARKHRQKTDVVRCHAVTLEPLAAYKTVYEAANEQGIRPSAIYGCLKKTRKTAGGFAWIRKDVQEREQQRK